MDHVRCNHYIPISFLDDAEFSLDLKEFSPVHEHYCGAIYLSDMFELTSLVEIFLKRS